MGVQEVLYQRGSLEEEKNRDSPCDADNDWLRAAIKFDLLQLHKSSRNPVWADKGLWYLN